MNDLLETRLKGSYSMLNDIINEFRESNGKSYYCYWSPSENTNCFLHCLHMSKINDVEHSPTCYLRDKAEAVGRHTFEFNERNTLYKIVYDMFGTDNEHKDVLLKPHLSCASYVSNGYVYATVRGW